MSLTNQQWHARPGAHKPHTAADAQAFDNEKQTQLNSLGRQVREYTRRINLELSRGEVQDMLADASDLLSFFEDNGLVTNAAFQTTLALRLALLLELLQLDELIGESEATLAVVRGNMRALAAAGRVVLEDWAASFTPTVDEVTVRERKPCDPRSITPQGICLRDSSRQTNLEVCMDLRSPRLQNPDKFCKSRSCTSGHIFGHVRKSRIRSCLDNATRPFIAEVREHADTVGIAQFRERNEATLFGEGFRDFLQELVKVEDLVFEEASLPEGVAAAAPVA